jgi:hypothetical protein
MFTSCFSGIRVAQSLVFCIILCPFVLFRSVIPLYVLLRFTNSDYPFGIFKLFTKSRGLRHKSTLLIEVYVPRRESEQSYICVRGIERSYICVRGIERSYICNRVIERSYMYICVSGIER